MIAAGVDVNAIEPDGFHPPLHLAIEQSWEAIVGELIRAGAEVNRPHPTTRTPFGGEWTPLVHAIDVASDAASQLGKPPEEVEVWLVELLLRAGAVPAESAFEAARAYYNAKALKLLEQYGSRPKDCNAIHQD